MELATTGAGLAAVVGEELHLLDLPHPDVSTLLRATGSLEAARSAAVRDKIALAAVDPQLGGLRSPFSGPTAVWGVGLNYRSKAATAGRDLPTEPILYLKPTNALAGPGDVLPVPAPRPAELDYEAELVLVIGSPLHQASAEEAWEAVAAVTTGNDMSARDVMVSTKNPTLAKGYPSFCPLGPSVLDASGFDDSLDLRVRSWVNGELRQDGQTSDFIFAVSDLLARLSHHTRLDAGDVVMTGTPPGTGQDRKDFLVDGDEITIQIGDLLPLVNRLGTATA